MVATQIGEDRQTLLKRLASARAVTDNVFQLVRPDSLYDRPIPERHRIVFYIGHLEAFDWNLLTARLPGLRPLDPTLDRLFAFGIDPVDGGLPTDQPKDWPALTEVDRYKSRVRGALDGALSETDFPDWDNTYTAETLLNAAIEHRLMHAETLAYMLHRLPIDRKQSLAQSPSAWSDLPQREMVKIPEGKAALGLGSGSSGGFGWDNEYERFSSPVAAFRIDPFKVTNDEYLRFMDAGGYQDAALWTPSDWAWRSQNGVTQPAFWEKRNAAGWVYRGMFDEMPLPFNSPVYVSHAEASAYAKWVGKRLPTEAEWHRAALDSSDARFPVEGVAGSGCMDDERWDPLPVNSPRLVKSAFGLEGMIGNGWEWTASLFEPFEGFRAFPFYPGYSADFFDGQHYVLKGGSTRTDRCMLRRSFRNWFQPHYQYIYAGFRCAAN